MIDCVRSKISKVGTVLLRVSHSPKPLTPMPELDLAAVM